jgi:hypothetical protein
MADCAPSTSSPPARGRYRGPLGAVAATVATVGVDAGRGRVGVARAPGGAAERADEHSRGKRSSPSVLEEVVDDAFAVVKGEQSPVLERAVFTAKLAYAGRKCWLRAARSAIDWLAT